jgi:hypothetical protein
MRITYKHVKSGSYSINNLTIKILVADVLTVGILAIAQMPSKASMEDGNNYDQIPSVVT